MSAPTPIAHRNVTLLRVETPAVLDELRALVDLAPFIVAQVDETTLVVDPGRTRELAQILGDAGLSPLVRRLRAEPAHSEADPGESGGG